MQENVPVKAGLLELLRNSQGKQFIIPAYQRNYIWTAKNEVKQLLDDIKVVLKGERTKHFIGIMIYLETQISPFFSERSVIDGQQRLTTIFLTLYAIKALMIENGREADAGRLETMYLINQFDESNKYKLKPLVSDDTVYQQIVSGDFDNIDDKKSNVYLNYCYIKSALQALLGDYSIDDILLALDKLYIVCVPIGKDDYPQKIFESINATGAKLTASDLIRNFILMPIQSEQQDDYYSRYWKRLEELIDSDSRKLEAFFRFYIMAKRKMLINKSTVYRSFTEWYNENEQLSGIEGIFKDIVGYASYYHAIYKEHLTKLDPAMRKPLEEFRHILSEMPAPFLMELFALHKSYDANGKPLISAKQFADIVEIITSYLMRRALCGMDTSDISRYFPALLKETLADCNGNYSDIVEVLKKNLVNRNKGNSQEMPDNNRLRDRIRNANMYNLRNWVSIFFRKLESENNPAPVDFSLLSIEHLMPQTATELWLEALQTDKDRYEENVHRLGNLTLAAKSDNSKMSNKVWDFKNKVLASTNHLKINHSILDKKKWTLEDIEERTLQLIDCIAELYPYYESVYSVVSKIHISLSCKDIQASAYYYPDNGSVEILAGSQLSINDPTVNTEKYPSVEALRNELIEEEIVVETNGKLIFTSDYLVIPKRVKSTALSPAAEIILHGSRNGKELWRTDDGYSIKDLDVL